MDAAKDLEAEIERLQEALLALYRAYPAEVTCVLELTLDGRRLLAAANPASDEQEGKP